MSVDLEIKLYNRNLTKLKIISKTVCQLFKSIEVTSANWVGTETWSRSEQFLRINDCQSVPAVHNPPYQELTYYHTMRWVDGITQKPIPLEYLYPNDSEKTLTLYLKAVNVEELGWVTDQLQSIFGSPTSMVDSISRYGLFQRSIRYRHKIADEYWKHG